MTGPTGSGKSTTLYATLNIINSPDRNIITVEDPVEYRLSGINQMQVNTKAGLTFASSLRSILRADPDVVLIGEIRDRETALIAMEAALTGHLVLSTLHTNDAASAITRLVEMEVEPYLVASALDCVVAQRLARQALRPLQGDLQAVRGRAGGGRDSPRRPVGRDRRSVPARWMLALRQDRLPWTDGTVRGHADERRDRTDDGRAPFVGGHPAAGDRRRDDDAARRWPREGSRSATTSLDEIFRVVV